MYFTCAPFFAATTRSPLCAVRWTLQIIIEKYHHQRRRYHPYRFSFLRLRSSQYKAHTHTYINGIMYRDTHRHTESHSYTCRKFSATASLLLLPVGKTLCVTVHFMVLVLVNFQLSCSFCMPDARRKIILFANIKKKKNFELKDEQVQTTGSIYWFLLWCLKFTLSDFNLYTH